MKKHVNELNNDNLIRIVTEGEYRGTGIEVDVVSIPFLDDVDEDDLRGVFAVNSAYIALNQDDQRFEVSLDMDGQSVNVIHIPDHIDILTVKRWNQGGSGEFVSVEGGLDKYRNGTQVYQFVEAAINGDAPDHSVSVFNEGGSGKFSTIEGLNGFRDGAHLYVNTLLELKLTMENPAVDNNIEEKTKAVQKYFDQLSGRMMAERAKDLSDEEINRTLSATVLPKFCIDAITHLRDHDGLTIDKVYGSWATMANRFYESAVEATLYAHADVDDISKLPFEKLQSPNLITEYRELVSSGNEVDETKWNKFVWLHVQREVTPDKYYSLMQERELLGHEEDTPEVDARVLEIDAILNKSGLVDVGAGHILTEFQLNVNKFFKCEYYLSSHGYEIQPTGPGRIHCNNDITVADDNEMDGRRKVGELDLKKIDINSELNMSMFGILAPEKQADKSAELYMVLSINNTENAAFIDVGREEEIARIIRDAAEKLDASILPDFIQKFDTTNEIALRDLNGNTVGSLHIVSEQPAIDYESHAGTVRLVAALQGDDLLDSAATILRTAADQFIHKDDNEFTLRDINGNSIGQFTYQEPESLLNADVVDMKAALDKGSVYLGDDTVSAYSSDGFRFVVTGGDYEYGYHEEPEETAVVNARGELAPDDGNEVIREILLTKIDRATAEGIRDVADGKLTLDAFESKYYSIDSDEPSL